MNADENEAGGGPSDIEQLAREMREKLQPDGPPVDWAAVHLYIAGDLNAEDAVRVREHIVTWAAWNQAYWETISLLEPAQGGAEEPADVEAGEQDEPPSKLSGSTDRKFNRRTLRGWAIVAMAASVLIVVGSVIWVQSVDRGRRIVAFVDDPFGRVTKTAGGELQGLEAFPQRWREPIGEMLRSETVRVPEEQIESLHVTRGAGPNMYVRPVSTVVRSDRPTFEWRSRGDDVRYRVLVFEVGEREPVMVSDEVKGARWEADRPLKRGGEYSWQVDVVEGSTPKAPSAARAFFRILDAAGLAKIEEQERQAKGSHLVLAVIYLKAALLDDAQCELELLKQQQGESAIVDKLLESLKEYR